MKYFIFMFSLLFSIHSYAYHTSQHCTSGGSKGGLGLPETQSTECIQSEDKKDMILFITLGASKSDVNENAYYSKKITNPKPDFLAPIIHERYFQYEDLSYRPDVGAGILYEATDDIYIGGQYIVGARFIGAILGVNIK